ncbi:MAG: LytTR family transcriptional regulator, partial [Chloroflexia bacterium]|nr:LytTR family transcriptional regulator [Chloroflexia bacterium]
IKADGKIYKITYDSILFVQALGDYIQLHTAERKIVTSHSMKEMEELLPDDKFMRVHRSYIVSMKKIEVIDGNTIKIGAHEIPVGKSYRTVFFEKINQKNM